MDEPQKPTSPTADDGLEAYVQSQLDKGKDAQTIMAEIQQAHEDLNHPYKAMAKGVGEGVMSLPVDILVGTYENAKGALTDFGRLLFGDDSLPWANSLVDAPANMKKQWDEGGPRERAKMVTELLGALPVGGAEGWGVKAATQKGAPGFMRSMGRNIQAAGESRMSYTPGAAMIGWGLLKGDPGRIGAGVATTALPPAMKFIGRKMRQMGGELPGVAELGSKSDKVLGEADAATVTELEKGQKRLDAKDNRMNGAIFRAQTKEAAELEKDATNADNLASIKEKSEGMTPGKTAIRFTSAATTPEGERVTATTPMVKPEAESVDGLSSAEVADLKKKGFNSETIARVAAEKGKPVAEGATVDMPSLRQQTPPTHPIEQEMMGRSGAAPAPATAPAAAPKVATPPPSPVPALVAPVAPPTPKPEKIPVPPTKSRRSPMSATPGLTVEDMKGLGLDPKIKLKAVTPDIVAKVRENRARRSDTYRTNAGLDAGAKRAADLDKP